MPTLLNSVIYALILGYYCFFSQYLRRVLELEEEYIKSICDDIIKMKPDLVITEKGISDLAQHFLVKANITAIRRLRKSDNNRVAR